MFLCSRLLLFQHQVLSRLTGIQMYYWLAGGEKEEHWGTFMKTKKRRQSRWKGGSISEEMWSFTLCFEVSSSRILSVSDKTSVARLFLCPDLLCFLCVLRPDLMCFLSLIDCLQRDTLSTKPGQEDGLENRNKDIIANYYKLENWNLDCSSKLHELLLTRRWW